MIIKDNSIEFDNVLRAATSINDDVKQTIKVNNFSFINSNTKGDFVSINNVEDLESLHKKGERSAIKVLEIISK